MIGLDVTAVSTTSTLIGTCRAADAGSRSTNSVTPSETAASTPTVNPFRVERVADRECQQDTEHHRGAALEREADGRPHRDLHHDERRQGSERRAGHPVTSPAIDHDRPAAKPDFATTPISVDVGGVHDVARPRGALPADGDGCRTIVGVPDHGRC